MVKCFASVLTLKTYRDWQERITHFLGGYGSVEDGLFRLRTSDYLLSR